MRSLFATAVLVLLSAHNRAVCQTQSDSNLPKIVHNDGRYALLVDGAPYLMLGAQVNNSSAWPAMLPKVWPAIEALHANTVEMPIYWEQFEPQPKRFDFSVVDTLLLQAREHGVRLVLLWFGTWKNGSGHYTPEWMKLAPERYPHMQNAKGETIDSLSPYAPATLEADTLAFCALLRHLKDSDPQHTVLMVQVENEAGTWGAVRDYSAAAEKLSDAHTELACDAFLKRALQYYKQVPSYQRPLTVNIYGDASGNQRRTAGSTTDWALIKHFFRSWVGTFEPFFYTASINPRIRDRVTCVNTRLRNAAGDARLFIDPSCKQLIRDLEEVSWALDSTGAATHELNKKDLERTHASDALGYFISQKFPMLPKIGHQNKPLYLG